MTAMILALVFFGLLIIGVPVFYCLIAACIVVLGTLGMLSPQLVTQRFYSGLDSFPLMAEVAAAHGFPFPYLYDESQDVARAYGAVCTPDFFGFNRDLELQYRGRLDSSGRNPGPVSARRELFEAMKAVAETGRGPPDQVPSMGCSIKWRDA